MRFLKKKDKGNQKLYYPKISIKLLGICDIPGKWESEALLMVKFQDEVNHYHLADGDVIELYPKMKVIFGK